MNPAAKGVDTAPSGSRIVYKAMPAVGADGQTIMKLIPVQTVKENFVPTQRSEPKSNPALKTAETLNMTNPAPAQVDPCVTRFVRTQVSLRNVLPNKRNMDHKPPPPTQPPLKKVPQTETPAAQSETSLMLPGHRSVTEKLSYKQIQRVPASHLPQSNSRHVFTPSANSSPGFYISPINPVNVDALLNSTSAPPSFKPFPDKSTPLEPKLSLKLIPQTPQRPNSPIRWMVEEDHSSALPALPSFGVASEILRTLAEWERAHKQPDVIDQSPSLSGQNNGGKKEEDALILCNGKVFKKCRPSLQTGKSDSCTTATKSYIFTKTTSPSESAQRKHVYKLVIPRRSHEVRDFCEDAQDGRSQKAASAVTSPDEDNVIFMSCTPPTSKSAPTEDLTPGTQTAAVRGTVQTGEESTKPPAGVNVCCKKHSNTCCTTQQVACMEHSSDTITPDSDSKCSAANMDTWIKESFGNPAPSSWLKPASQNISDHLLRRMFGITADIKICLQRMDEASAGSPAERHHSEFTQTEVQHQEATSKVHEEELFISELHSPHESDSYSESISVKSVEELSADSASLTSHTLTRPLKCSHLEAKTKPQNHSGQSDAETDTLIGYMEPIDEDFISMDEEHKQEVAAGTPEDKRRIGRTRKRTTCPCCVSGAQNQALKLSLKTVFPGKKGGAKTARKRVRASGKIRCPAAKRKSSDSVSCSSSGDSDELRCHKEIRRLRELLREKEEALELLRRNSS